jgi:hypothetical protein
MPQQEPVIDTSATQVSPSQDTAIQHAAVQAPDAATYEPAEEQGEWLDEPPESELPPRPRRKLLTPIPLALLGVLLIACGFIGGVLIEKGENSSSVSSGGAAGLASRFAALRGGALGATGAGARSGSSSTAGGGTAGASGGFTRPTAGTVAYLDGSTLYVTNSEGNTVKVMTSAGTTVNKTVKSAVKSIHPGETVTITGETGSGGAISAESISVGSSGGGLASLFGGSGAGGTAGGGKSSGGNASGEPALFGG